MSHEVTAAVSGSFRYKDKIDGVIDVLEETGIKVLEPTKGWLIRTPLQLQLLRQDGYIRPLPTEEGLTPGQIEGRFLEAVATASLLYILNFEGYVGNSTAGELGFALAGDKPIYAHEPINYRQMEMYDLHQRQFVESRVIILSPESVYTHYVDNFLQQR